MSALTGHIDVSVFDTSNYRLYTDNVDTHYITASSQPYYSVQDLLSDLDKIDWVGKVQLGNEDQAKGWDLAIGEIRKYLKENV